MLKASIITVCFNSSKTILDCIESVNMQSYSNLEHIFIDSNSTDQTVNFIKRNSTRKFRIISEYDEGIYDAMNKGVRFASGNFICFLNSDDFFHYKNVIEMVSKEFERNNLDIVYGNIDYVNEKKQYIRTFNSPEKFIEVLNGFQIPHPALFVKTTCLKNLDYSFNKKFKIASDFGQQIYLAHNYNLKTSKIDKSLVQMRTGGLSSKFINRVIGWMETVRIYNQITKKNGFIFALKKVLNNLKSAKKQFS